MKKDKIQFSMEELRETKEKYKKNKRSFLKDCQLIQKSILFYDNKAYPIAILGFLIPFSFIISILYSLYHSSQNYLLSIITVFIIWSFILITISFTIVLLSILLEYFICVSGFKSRYLESYYENFTYEYKRARYKNKDITEELKSCKNIYEKMALLNRFENRI